MTRTRGDPARVTDPQPVPSTTPAPAADAVQPPAGAPDPTATTPPAPAAAPASTVEITPEIQALLDEAAKKASRDANAEAIKAKKERDALLKAEQDRKDAELSETERLQKERDEAVKAAEQATATARAVAVNAALERAAIAAGFADPTDALSLADAITTDESGQPVGVTEAVAALLTAKPHYAKGPSDPSLDANNGQRNNRPTLTPQQQTEQLYAPVRNGSFWNQPAPK